MDNTPTVFLVDDDQAIRDALTLFLESHQFVVAPFESAADFLKGFQSDSHGCLVLDIRMPGMGGLELQEHLSREGIHIPVIFVTGHGDVPMAVRAIKSGACDFLEKPFNNNDLLKSIRNAIKLDKHIRQRESLQRNIHARYATLTNRERQVMTLVAEGYSNKSIATQLHISHRTVEIHRRRVMKKMQAGSMPELVSMAVSCGIHEYKSDKPANEKSI